MVRIRSAALTCATFGLLAVTLPGTAAEAARTRLGSNNSAHGDVKLTGYNGVHLCGPNHFVQTKYWYSNMGTTTTECSATTTMMSQAVVGLKLCTDPTIEYVFHSAPWTPGSTCKSRRSSLLQHNLQQYSGP